MKNPAALVLVMITVGAAAAPAVAPNNPGTQFRELLFAPPMPVHIVDAAGAWHAPFVYRIELRDRLERRYEEDRSVRVSLDWLSGGRVLALEGDGPLLLLGTDSLGRDVFSRLLHGARTSLGVALLGVLGALLAGTLLGGLAGYAGGALDEGLMRAADFVLVLPAIYVVLALRAVLPLVLPAWAVFSLLVALLSMTGWPYAARGVRAIVAAEAGKDYAAAARSLGAGHFRLLVRHLLPAASGFLVGQALLLLPGFILAEATLSYVGLGFAEPTPSWGSMLREAADVAAIAQFPWLLSPAAVILIFVLSVNIVAAHRSQGDPIGLLNRSAVLGPGSLTASAKP